MISKVHFTPIVLEIIIETEEELCDLAYRFYLEKQDVVGRSIYKHPMSDTSTDKIWLLLDRLVEAYGLKET